MENAQIADKNTPYWWEEAPVKPLPRQPLAKKLDVAIIGAGYAGLSAGLVLAREGRSVAAFDAMNPGEGASTRNGGITSGSIRPDYATITRRFGEHLASLGYADHELRVVLEPGGQHSEADWQRRFPEAMAWLLR